MNGGLFAVDVLTQPNQRDPAQWQPYCEHRNQWEDDHMVKTAVVIVLAALTLTGCATATPPAALPETFSGTGTFVAGEDIRPGYYEQATPEPGCEYAVQNEAGDTIAMNGGEALLIAGEGATVTIEGCGDYTWFQD